MTVSEEHTSMVDGVAEQAVEVVIQPPTPESTPQKAIPALQPDDDDTVAAVFWEATVTGRRLIDEIINIGAYYGPQEEPVDGQEFNEYVMPYGKLPLNIIRNYNLRIVDTGRYRMLKEIRNNKMLKSKSEVAACNDFASWLIELQKQHFPDKMVVLVFFEPRHSKILQLFQALERFRLLDDVKKILLGCVNGWDLLRQQVHELRDEHRMVLKALTDHHLGAETSLETAAHRAQALHKILRKVHGGRINITAMKEHLISCDYMLEQVRKIKEELIKEAQWRPVFAEMFRQGVKPRRRAGFLRHLLVESGLTYFDVSEKFRDNQDEGVSELVKEKVKGKNEVDIDEVIKLLNQHLAQPDRSVRRGSGRRGPRTRSVSSTNEMEKSIKKEEEENNNEPVKVAVMPMVIVTPVTTAA